MTVTLSMDGTQVATDPQAYGASVNTATVMVVNFSNGTRIAITNFDDKEDNDPVYGIEAPSGGTEVANIYMYGMNYTGSGATFTVYDYTSGNLGTLLYTFLDNNNPDATIQLRFDTTTNALSIYTSTQGYYPDDAGAVPGFAGTLASTSAVCFLRGTRILTDRGEVAIEYLAAGDRVATRFGGLRAIRWIGTQTFAGRLAGTAATPVRFAAGSLGDGLPHTALCVSPGHAMLVGNVLAHAGALVNDATITQPPMTGEIEYFHLDLGPHDCVLANGAWAETYFEDRNRDSFHNAADFHARFAGHLPVRQDTCLPIITATDPRLPALHASLAPNQDAAALMADPDLHLLADGQRLELRQAAPGAWQAIIPAGITTLRLCSRTIRPSMLGCGTDHRALGLMVHGIAIEGGETLTPDHPALSYGWHAPERHGARMSRWTAGEAAIPTHLLGDGPSTLTLHGWHPALSLPALEEAARQAA